jgi:hypothetical protein
MLHGWKHPKLVDAGLEFEPSQGPSSRREIKFGHVLEPKTGGCS